MVMTPMRNEHKRWFLRRILVLIIGFMMAFSLMTPAFAAKDMVYIQCSVNLTTWHITSAVTVQSIGSTKQSPELRRMGPGVLDRLSATDSLDTTLAEYANLEEYASQFDDGFRKSPYDDWNGGLFDTNEENRLMMFPSDGNNDSKDMDMSEATRVQEQLCTPLNEAIDWYLKKNNITKTESIYDFYKTMKGFLEDVRDHSSGDTYSIEVDGTTYTYLWRILKYTGAPDSNRDRPQYVTWGYVIYEAVNNYVLQDSLAVREDNAYAAEVGTFEEIITNLLDSMLNQLRNLLGYWSMDALLFNTGTERTNQYIGGIFPKSWESTIWALFMVTEIISAMIIMVAILTNVLKRASSTLNTFARTRMMKQIEDIIICAVLLSVLPLLLRLLISLSGALTEMAYSIVPQSGGRTRSIDDSVATFLSASGTLGGVIGEFMYFGIQTYINFFYAIRTLTVAVLIVIAPLMITFIAISDAKKQTAITWARELMANVFIQPIHAFIMAIVLVLPPSNHSFDNIIALYALIPITSMIRNLFFGQGGSWADQVAQKARARTTGALAAAGIAGGTAVATGAVGGARNAITAGRERDSNNAGNTSSQNGSASDVGGQSNVATNNIQGDANATGAVAAAGAGAGASVGAGAAAEDTNENAREVDPGASAAADGNLNNISNGTIPAASAVSAAVPSGTGSATGTASRSATFAANHPHLSKMGRAAANGAKTVGRGALGGAIGIGKALPGAALAMVGAAVGGAGGSSLANMGNRLVHNSTQPKESKNKKPVENQNNASTQQAQTTQPKEESQDPTIIGGVNTSNTQSTEKAPDVTTESAAETKNIPVQDEPIDPAKDKSTEVGADKSMFNDGGIVPEGNSLVHKYNASPEALKKSGMEVTDSDKDNITVKIDPNKAAGEAADIAKQHSYLRSLDPETRQKVMDETGIYTSVDKNGNVIANINKVKWKKRTGNEIQPRFGKNGTGLQISSKDGAATPSLVGNRSLAAYSDDLKTNTVVPQMTTKNDAELQPLQEKISKANPGLSNAEVQEKAVKYDNFKEFRKQHPDMSAAEAKKAITTTQYKEIRQQHPELPASEAKKIVAHPSEYYDANTLSEQQKSVIENAVQQGAATQIGNVYHVDREQMKQTSTGFQAVQKDSLAPSPKSTRVEANRHTRKRQTRLATLAKEEKPANDETPASTQRMPSSWNGNLGQGPTPQDRSYTQESSYQNSSLKQEPKHQDRDLGQGPTPQDRSYTQESSSQNSSPKQEPKHQDRDLGQGPTPQDRSYTQESSSQNSSPKQEPKHQDRDLGQGPTPQDRNYIQKSNSRDRNHRQEPKHQDRNPAQNQTSKNQNLDSSANTSSVRSVTSKEAATFEKFKNGENVPASDLLGDDFNFQV